MEVQGLYAIHQFKPNFIFYLRILICVHCKTLTSLVPCVLIFSTDNIVKGEGTACGVNFYVVSQRLKICVRD